MRALLKPMKDRGFTYPTPADREYFDLDLTGDICALRDMESGRWRAYVRAETLPSLRAMDAAVKHAKGCDGVQALPVLYELAQLIPGSASPAVKEALGGKWARVADLSEYASAAEAKKRARLLQSALVYAGLLDSI